MQRSLLEAGLLAVVVGFISTSLFASHSRLVSDAPSRWKSEGLAMAAVGMAAVASEMPRVTSALRATRPRFGASSGLLLGALALPMVFASRAIQDARSGANAGLLASLRFWATLACGGGMVGSAVLLCLYMECRSVANVQQTGGRTSQAAVGKNMCRTGKGEGSFDEAGMWTAMAMGWLPLSLVTVAVAICCSGWEGSGGQTAVTIWLLGHVAVCGGLWLTLLRMFPSTASSGEALLVAEGVTLVALDALGRTVAKVTPSLPLPPHCARALSGTGDEIDAIVQGILVGVFLLPGLWALFYYFAAFLLNRTPQSLQLCPPSFLKASTFYGALLVLVVGLVPLWLYLVVGLTTHPLIWAIEHILENARVRIALCCYWLLVMLLPLQFLQRIAMEGKVAHIIVRKFYHLMAVAMFVPAVMFQTGFLRLAFGIALGAFLILEIVRVCKIPPFGVGIDAFMCAFIDSRDGGLLIIRVWLDGGRSHFSLLLGCALPIWMSDVHGDRPLALFAGLLSLGVGDTMASVVGSRFGHICIADDSNKTVEGTMAGVGSMLAACILLSPFLPSSPDLLSFSMNSSSAEQWTSVGTATIVAGLLEAFTTQLDNAFVPLIYYSLLCL